MRPTDSSANGDEPSRRLARASHSGPDGTAAVDRDAPGTIDGLTVALGRLRRGAAALREENQQLRAEIARLQLGAADRRGDAPTRELGKLAEIALPAGSGAPGAARMVTAHCLSGLVSERILHDAELLVSELVTNSLDHGELRDGDVVLLRVYLAGETLRLEIENPGVSGVVGSNQPPSESGGGGYGLRLVDLLSAHWGVSRAQNTSVWFEMHRA